MMNKMKGQSLKMSILFFVLLCGLICEVSGAGVAEKCSQQLSNVAQCLSFASGKAETPTKECCTSVKGMRDSDPECLCFMIQQTHNGSEAIKNLGIQEARLLQLPTACNLKNSSISDCPKLLGLAPGSPDAAIFTNASTATPTPTSSSSSEKANASDTNFGTRLGPHLTGLMAMAIAIFLLAFPAGSAATSIE
ncbi:non-specific lipid transfer protein GPI-anchored 1 [Quercus robur]|uniref:non-specific lipid transfer protein GPI-anchored 1 n=1 Tax=Quercus robur TaxID=38942 RepID=UPI00216368FF|nr:non-specific lipid transfer protein GPI-anchored 1 [Quercus robur]